MKRLLLTLAIALMGVAPAAFAVQISPLSKVHTIDKDRGVLTLTNTDASTKRYQVFVDRLTVENGVVARRVATTTEFRMVPSVVEVKAGAQQAIRWLRTDGVKDREVVYRIRVEEVHEQVAFKQLNLVTYLNQDFSWIFRPLDAKPALQASWQGDKLVVSNTGTATAELSGLVAGSTQFPGYVGSVLPGERRVFDLNFKAPAPRVSVKVNGVDQVLEAR